MLFISIILYKIMFYGMCKKYILDHKMSPD